MDLEACRNLIVFGGSFDPPHMGHVKLPEFVMERTGADKVAYVPAAAAPLKVAESQSPAADRLAMLEAALANCDHALILTDEMDRASDHEPSYTVDTIENLRRRLGKDVHLRLLIGMDQLAQFDRWKSAQRIIDLANPLVMTRPSFDIDELVSLMPDPQQRRQWGRRLVAVEPMDISSTEIRGRVARGDSIAGLVPPAVEAYIRDHGLYRQQ